jgi:hypothetical protein
MKAKLVRPRKGHLVPPGEMKKREKQGDDIVRRLRELLELARSRLDVPQ